MSTEEAQQKQYRDAAVKFVCRTTVFLAAANDLSKGALSGVLLQSRKGKTFVLTAKHIAFDDDWRPEEWRPLRMAAGLTVPGLSNLDIQDVATEILFPPSTGRPPEKPLDVAAILLRPEVEKRVSAYAASIDAIAETDETTSTDVVVMVGFPSYLRFPSALHRNLTWVSTITHFTGVTGRDRFGRLEVDWDEAIPHEGHPTYPHIDVQAGQVMKLQMPKGISGGGVWRIRGARSDAVWSPTSHAKLIGVPVAFLKPTEFAESVLAWGPWLRELAATLDAE